MFFENLWNYFSENLIKYGISLIYSIFFIVCGYFLIKILKITLEKTFCKIGIHDRFIINMVKKLVRIGIWVVVFMLVLHNFQINVSNLIIAMSPIFLTLGLGCKNFINNFIKGLQLKILNPYTVGDQIEIDDVKGKVEQVDFLYTYLITEKGGFATIANSQIADKKIINFTKQKKIIDGVDLQINPAQLNAGLPLKSNEKNNELNEGKKQSNV